jgi:hypothetical protein
MVARYPPEGRTVIVDMMHKRLISISLAALMLVSLCAVCATTSVTAATNSGGTQASSQAKITDIVGAPPGGGLNSAPAVCSWGPGRLDVFATGTNYHLWHTWWDGTGWHSWEDLGDPSFGIGSAPTAVSWGAGRIDVFATGGVGVSNLLHKWFYNGWHDWENLGVPPGKDLSGYSGIFGYSAPAACSWGNGRLDIFALGSDGQLWQLWFSSGWHDWYPLGRPSGYLVGSPGAVATVSWGYQRIDIFIRGGDGNLWQLWYNGAWQPWHRFDDTRNLGVSPYETSGCNTAYGYEFYAPAVCSMGANRLDVFFVNHYGYLEQLWFNGAWQPLYQVGGYYFMSASPSAVTWQSSVLGSPPRMDIFTRGYDFALWQLYYAEWWGVCYNNGILVPCFIGGWHGWYNLGLM